MKYKIHHSFYEHGRPSGLSLRLLLLVSVVRALLRVSFFIIILVFYCSFLDPMFKLINIKHLMMNFNTCQNL